MPASWRRMLRSNPDESGLTDSGGGVIALPLQIDGHSGPHLPAIALLSAGCDTEERRSAAQAHC